LCAAQKIVMEFVEQSHKDLYLRVTADIDSLWEYKMLSKASLNFQGLQIEFGILGESHYVLVANKSSRFAEVFACGKKKYDDGIEFSDLIGSSFEKQFGDISYQFEMEVVNELESSKLSRLREKRNDPDVKYLKHDFPAKDKDLSHPVTEVYLNTKGVIIVESVHTYPNENVSVFTKSNFFIT